MSDAPMCKVCGAPKAPGFAACKFCKTAFVENTQTEAIPCPRCPTLNEWGAQKCVQCQAWVVVQCVFCQSLSPHHVAACLKCHEAFLGAPERLQQRQAAASHQHNMQIAGTVGNVAASFLGAVAGAALTNSYGSHHHHHNQSSSFFGGDDSGSSFGSSSSDSSSYSDNNSGGGGGGLLDALTGGGSSDDSSSSDDSGGGGGGLMDSLFGDSGGSSSDDG